MPKTNANPSVANTHPAGGGGGRPRASPDTEHGTSITHATSVSTHGPKWRSRSIVFTIWETENRPLPTQIETLREYATRECEYLRFGREIAPTTGRAHLQGWLQWRSSRYVNPFWVLFDHPHVEPRHGNVDDNQRYTSKDGEWEEFGTPPKQGERTDWALARRQLAERVPVREVIDAQPQLLPTIRALERYATLTRQPPNDRDVRVLYIYGSAGCGKTRTIRDKYPNAFWKPEGDWWDGYEGQEVVVLDDYYSDLAYKTALRVLDRYPLRLPVKGGFVPAEFTTVVITSNATLDEQYLNILGTRRQALYRRIHRVIDADSGISTEIITDALQDAPHHPQVQVPKVRHPADDATPDPTHPAWERAGTREL